MPEQLSPIRVLELIAIRVKRIETLERVGTEGYPRRVVLLAHLNRIAQKRGDSFHRSRNVRTSPTFSAPTCSSPQADSRSSES
jgi:hypothetical protein